MNVVLLMLAIASSIDATAQTVVMPWELKCADEQVVPNLHLIKRTHVSGEIVDATEAPVADSPVELRSYGALAKQSSYKKVKTNRAGQFSFGKVHAGKYRLLPAPNRGFKQPERVFCDSNNCKLKLVLQANPTDLPYAGCPLK